MGIVPAFARDVAERRDRSRGHRSDRDASRLATTNAHEEQGAAVSCRTYERLMAGETVSWREIVREHPMLGQVTVPALVSAGVVQVTPNHDSRTGRIDFRLRKRDPEHVHGVAGTRGRDRARKWTMRRD